jgi:hypothetical protein
MALVSTFVSRKESSFNESVTGTLCATFCGQQEENTMNEYMSSMLSEGSQNSIIKSQCTHHDPVSRVVIKRRTTGVYTVIKVRRDGFNAPLVRDNALLRRDQSVKRGKSEEEVMDGKQNRRSGIGYLL